MGKKLNYQESIKESSTELENLLKGSKDSVIRDRVRFLWLLKTGKSTTQEEASKELNICIRQGQRHWQRYKKGGLESCLIKGKGGANPKLSKEELDLLGEKLEGDEIQFLQDAVSYIKDTFGKEYTIPGIHYLFKRLKIKKNLSSSKYSTG